MLLLVMSRCKILYESSVSLGDTVSMNNNGDVIMITDYTTSSDLNNFTTFTLLKKSTNTNNWIMPAYYDIIYGFSLSIYTHYLSTFVASRYPK